MIAMAVSGNFDQRPDTSMRIPQARATSASRNVTLIATSVRVVVERACRQRAAELEGPLVADGSEEPVEGREAGMQVIRPAAEADAQMALGLEVDAGHDHGG